MVLNEQATASLVRNTIFRCTFSRHMSRARRGDCINGEVVRQSQLGVCPAKLQGGAVEGRGAASGSVMHAWRRGALHCSEGRHALQMKPSPHVLCFGTAKMDLLEGDATRGEVVNPCSHFRLSTAGSSCRGRDCWRSRSCALAWIVATQNAGGGRRHGHQPMQCVCRSIAVDGRGEAALCSEVGGKVECRLPRER